MRSLRATVLLLGAGVMLTIAAARNLPRVSAGIAQQHATLPTDAARLATLMHEVADQQAQYLQRAGTHFRYHLHRVDPREDTLRAVIESSGGNITRLLQHNGQALTPAENDGDLNRLTGYITSGDLRKKEREEKRNHAYGLELIHAMPDAMLYTLTPGQPQLPSHDRPQLVLDFAPNPEFRPASTAEGLLSGISGRLWIDTADHHLVRMEATTLRNLDLAMGILIRVYPGGTVEYDQRRVAENTYAFSHIRMHLRLRELMIKTVPYDSDLVATDIEAIEPTPTPEQAVQTLLNVLVKTR